MNHKCNNDKLFLIGWDFIFYTSALFECDACQARFILLRLINHFELKVIVPSQMDDQAFFYPEACI